MFNKKYVFETKETRLRRFYRNVLLFFLSGFMALILLCIFVPIHARNLQKQADEAFFQKAPDMIAVFTGDAGRIDYAFKKAEQYPSATLFISGVHSKNSLKTLLIKQGQGISVDDYLEQESHHVEIEYLARNTVENAIATLNDLRSHPEFKNILVISSDYHILRIQLIFAALKRDNENYNIYFESIQNDYKKLDNIKKLFKEVYKLLKTTTFLIFWDNQ